MIPYFSFGVKEKAISDKKKGNGAKSAGVAKPKSASTAAKHNYRTLIYHSYLNGKRGEHTQQDTNRERIYKQYCSTSNGSFIDIPVSTQTHYEPSEVLVWNFYQNPTEFPPDRSSLRPINQMTKQNVTRVYAVDRPGEKATVIAIWYQNQYKTVRFSGSDSGKPFFYIDMYNEQNPREPIKLYGDITYIGSIANSPRNSPRRSRSPSPTDSQRERELNEILNANFFGKSNFGKRKSAKKVINSLSSLKRDLKKILKM
jgi:hypothetical protein